MNFLPQNYQLPKAEASNYFRLEDGDNIFRVLSEATVGWKYWTDSNGTVLERPVKGCTSVYVKTPQEAKPSARHFWAFVVWNYKEEQVQVLELTQNSIQEAITQVVTNPNWGDPTTYDLIVKKAGSGLDTTYHVSVNPKKPLDDGIVKMYENMRINLEAFFSGDDPFKSTENVEVDSKAVATASR